MKTLIAAAFAACVGAAAAMPAAQAAPLAPAPAIQSATLDLVTPVAGGQRWNEENPVIHYGKPWKKKRRHGVYLQFGWGYPHPHWGVHPGIIYHPRPVIRPNPVIRLTRAHISWCYNRYRTYDHHTNLFVAKHGRHKHCVSPYSH
ncbi:MAG: BA14K family protein [Rhizobiaceae bacterium]|nr:BA14K family protein [Rhizobiaceae bacterium]